MVDQSKAHRAKPIVIDGVDYPSVAQASRETGHHISTIRRRVWSEKKKFRGWHWKNTDNGPSDRRSFIRALVAAGESVARARTLWERKVGRHEIRRSDTYYMSLREGETEAPWNTTFMTQARRRGPFKTIRAKEKSNEHE